jgi:hypothetical protein
MGNIPNIPNTTHIMVPFATLDINLGFSLNFFKGMILYFRFSVNFYALKISLIMWHLSYYREIVMNRLTFFKGKILYFRFSVNFYALKISLIMWHLSYYREIVMNRLTFFKGKILYFRLCVNVNASKNLLIYVAIAISEMNRGTSP